MVTDDGKKMSNLVNKFSKQNGKKIYSGHESNHELVAEKLKRNSPNLLKNPFSKKKITLIEWMKGKKSSITKLKRLVF